MPPELPLDEHDPSRTPRERTPAPVADPGPPPLPTVTLRDYGRYLWAQIIPRIVSIRTIGGVAISKEISELPISPDHKATLLFWTGIVTVALHGIESVVNAWKGRKTAVVATGAPAATPAP